MFSEDDGNEDGQDNEVEQFRIVHKEAESAKGRSIPSILYDRSLRGRNGVYGLTRRIKYESDPKINLSKSSTKTHPQIENEASITAESSFKSAIDPKFASNIHNESPASGKSVMDFPPNDAQIQSQANTKKARAHLNSPPCKIINEIRNYGELYSVIKFQTSYLLGGSNSTSSAVSTISIAFSSDGDALASTHGDHTVKITCCHSGRILETLEGHPRTPWTVKFHPTNKYIVASGCLGFQVRVWDWSLKTGHCLNMIRLKYAIISLAFHPSGGLLAVASGNSLYLWDYDNQQQYKEASGDDGSGQSFGNSSQRHNSMSTLYKSRYSSSPIYSSAGRRNDRYGGNNEVNRGLKGTGTVIEMRHDKALRCVHFPPEGKTIIVGGVNNAGEGGIDGMIFSLKLFDFDMSAVSRRRMERGRGEALKNPRTFVNRALLYNDGGFDVSPCGKFLCACAEYWLPEGVKCAADLTPQDDYDYDDDNDQSDFHSSPVRSPKECEMPPRADTYESSPPLSTPSGNVGKVESAIHENPKSMSTPYTARLNTNANSHILSTPPRKNESKATSSAATMSNTNSNTQSQNLFSSQAPFAQSANPASQFPITPPAQTHQAIPLSPPSPPGRRLIGGLTSHRSGSSNSAQIGRSNSPPYPPNVSPPVTPPVKGPSYVEGSFVPHVVTISLEPHKLGTLLEAAPLDGAKAKGVTCVKFSPSAEFCLLGYGVRENITNRRQRTIIRGKLTVEEYEEDPSHPVTAIYRIKGGMTHVSTMMSKDDDVNIARFHPHSGHGFVYGTKQGRVRILSPKPWNYLSAKDEHV